MSYAGGRRDGGGAYVCKMNECTLVVGWGLGYVCKINNCLTLAGDGIQSSATM